MLSLVVSNLYVLVAMLSCRAAGHGNIRAILEDMKLLSTEAEGVSEAIPEESRPRLVNAAGRVGALLGLQAAPPQQSVDSVSAATSAAANALSHPLADPLPVAHLQTTRHPVAQPRSCHTREP